MNINRVKITEHTLQPKHVPKELTYSNCKLRFKYLFSS